MANTDNQQIDDLKKVLYLIENFTIDKKFENKHHAYSHDIYQFGKKCTNNKRPISVSFVENRNILKNDIINTIIENLNDICLYGGNVIIKKQYSGCVDFYLSSTRCCAAVIPKDNNVEYAKLANCYVIRLSTDNLKNTIHVFFNNDNRLTKMGKINNPENYITQTSLEEINDNRVFF